MLDTTRRALGALMITLAALAPTFTPAYAGAADSAPVAMAAPTAKNPATPRTTKSSTRTPKTSAIAATTAHAPQPVTDWNTDPAGYGWYATNANGAPAGWSTCRPIRYRVNLADVPVDQHAQIRQDITDAFAEVTAGSGYDFQNLGDTPILVWQTDQWWTDPVAGDADILVTYANHTTVPALYGNGGLAGGSYVDDANGTPYFRHAGVAVNTSTLDYPNRNHAKGVLLHEIGHAMGLSHTDSSKQIMNISNPTATVFALQNGDKAGLQELRAKHPCTW